MNAARIVRPFAAAAALAALAACTDGTGVGAGEVQLSLADAGSSTLSSRLAEGTSSWLLASLSGSSDGQSAISRDTVASLSVTVTSVQFLRAGESDEDDSPGWITLELETPVQLELTALPSEGESPLIIASGSVEAGTYSMVRLFVSSATIRFKGDVSLGAAITFSGGVDYSVTIPSGDQTGIKTDVSFTVEAGEGGVTADVGLLFEANTTYASVTATGAGSVIMAPVLRSR
jgi:hypothetical protein